MTPRSSTSARRGGKAPDPAAIDPLTRLAIANGTDKFGYHDYTPNYHRLFGHLRDRPLRLLEIGVGGYQDADRGGESLETWRDYFPKARVVGIDIQEKRLDLGQRITILQGSQVDAGFLDRVVADHGPFDIIIDDGSHRNAHVVDSFNLLYPGLAPGGIYVVEDVQTAFFPRFGGSLELTPPNSVGYLGELFAELPAGDAPLDIAAISRFHNMIAVHKTPEGGRPDGAEAAFTDGAGPAARLAGAAEVADLQPAFGKLADGQVLAVAAPSADLALRLFKDIDHREIAVNFPDYAPHALARQISRLVALPGTLLLERGENDYPSNFAFDFAHPAVGPVFRAIETVLAEQGRERGILQFVDLLVRAGDEDRAAELLERLAERGATTRPYYNLAVRRARREGDDTRARALLEAAVERYPDDARFQAQLGGQLARAGEVEAARGHLERARDLAPRDAGVRMQLAGVLSRLGAHEAALAEADEALRLAPDRPGFLLQTGRMQIEAGDLDAAMETLGRATATADAPAAAWRQLSRAHELAGQRDQALAAIDRALQIDPDNAEYARWKARLTG